MASKHNLISRLTQIVSVFQRQGSMGLSFEEVNMKLKGASVDENRSISLRTFQRDLKDIESSLNIRIVYNKSLKKYVLEQDAVQPDARNNRLFTMESINQLNIAQDASNNDFILIEERKPLGLENYNTIREAIVKNCYLEFEYQRFDQYKASKRKIMPLALKENNHRWYVVGYELKDGLRQQMLKTFALDRMDEVQIGTGFVLHETVDFRKHFNDYCGISTKPLEGFTGAVDVKIETSIEYGKYFSTLPVHSSQKTEIEKGKTFLYFHLIPTMEFVAELLSHNARIKVLEPAELVSAVKKHLQENIQQYG